jgi:hypothetical protein
MNEMLLIHSEEINLMKWIYYSPFESLDLIIKNINNILLNVKNNSYFYYDPENLLWNLQIPHDKGILMIHIKIHKIIRGANLDTILNLNQKIKSSFDNNYYFAIEIIRYKGITNYLIIRSWLEKNLLSNGWIKAK